MESFSSVKALALCEWFVNMSHTTLVMYIHFFTTSQDTTEVDATYHQLLMSSVTNYKNVTKTKIKLHMH